MIKYNNLLLKLKQGSVSLGAGEPEAYTAEAPQRSLPLVDLTCVSADGGEGSKWDEGNKELQVAMTILFVLCQVQQWRILLRHCDGHTTSALGESRLRNLTLLRENGFSRVTSSQHSSVALLFSSTGWSWVSVTPNKRCLTWRLYEVQ